MGTLIFVLSVLGAVALVSALLSHASSSHASGTNAPSWLMPSPKPDAPGRNAPAPPPANAPGNGRTAVRRPRPGYAKASGHQLDAQKTIHAFDFILKSFGQCPPWSTPQEKDDYVHDLVVMLDQRDLRTASVELLGHDRTVLYRHRIEFRPAANGPAVDAARGIELPVIPAASIASHRILVAPVARLAQYRGRLRRSWGSAEKLRDRDGSCFDSEHTRCINRGRMSGKVFVSDEVRRTGIVVTVSSAGDYAFARCPEFPVDVYLRRAECVVPMSFQTGIKVSFIPSQVPRGLQGRSIRPAN